MKEIFLIFLLITATFGQEINCEYEDTSDYGDESKKTFTCRLRINNLNGFDDFERIPGNHDDDVNAIEKSVGQTSIIPSILCKQFVNLEILSLAEKEIEIVSRQSMESCRHLGALYLSNNKIREIHRDAFEGPRGLRFLDLEGNQLEHLPDELFRTLSKLEWLSISNNPLHELPENIFKSLTSLQYLYISNCHIVDIKNDWFISTPRVLYLDMSNNKIDELPAAVFVPLTELRHLIMSNNQLTVLNSNAFQSSSLKNLKSLTFNGNSIEAVDPDIFDAAENLKIARFYKNNCVDDAVEADVTTKGKIVLNDDKFSVFYDCISNFEAIANNKGLRDEL
ncbi:leucine-rich repeat-containing protein 4B-like [Chironomus tepperi]|uniref:leucine-rich repeat-containing protein 4B-like n=1 Tax=Chironomus tepperi TaxID=113505 RepID=UPI00391EE3C8